jgi:hypothetical protein
MSPRGTLPGFYTISTKNCSRRLHHATGVFEVILHQREKGDFPLFTQTGHEGYEAFGINGRKEIQKDISLFSQTGYEGFGYLILEREMKNEVESWP